MWFSKRNQKQQDPVKSPVTPEQIGERLKFFVANRSKLVQEADLQPDTPLFSSGLLDSLSFVELVLFIDKEFKVKLSEGSGLNFDALNTIGLITERVEQALNS